MADVWIIKTCPRKFTWEVYLDISCLLPPQQHKYKKARFANYDLKLRAKTVKTFLPPLLPKELYYVCNSSLVELFMHETHRPAEKKHEYFCSGFNLLFRLDRGCISHFRYIDIVTCYLHMYIHCYVTVNSTYLSNIYGNITFLIYGADIECYAFTFHFWWSKEQ